MLPSNNLPALVTLLGITIFSIDVFDIIEEPNVFTPSGIINSSNTLQLLNACASILITLLGIVMLVKLLHP